MLKDQYKIILIIPKIVHIYYNFVKGEEKNGKGRGASKLYFR